MIKSIAVVNITVVVTTSVAICNKSVYREKLCYTYSIRMSDNHTHVPLS